MLNWIGVLIAGILNGSFAVPLKTARVWKFHQIWMVHSLLAMAVWPWALVVILVPDWRGIISAVPLRGWLGLIGWGILFAVGSLLYGAAVDLLGIALGFAIQLGLSIVLGAIIPLIWTRAISLADQRDAFFLGGLAVMVVGVIVCAQSGRAKGEGAGPSDARFRKGLVIALVGGILAPTLNFGIQYGTYLLKPVLGPGTGGFSVQTYLAWAVFLSAAALVQAGFCLYRMIHRRTLGVYRQPGSALDALQVVVMSVLWISSIFIYGRSSSMLGRIGYSIGWPVFIALIILTSNAWGLVLGEWRGAPRAVVRKMLVGSAVLAAAAFLIGQGGR